MSQSKVNQEVNRLLSKIISKSAQRYRPIQNFQQRLRCRIKAWPVDKFFLFFCSFIRTDVRIEIVNKVDKVILKFCMPGESLNKVRAMELCEQAVR
jgi:hypothetical protein